MRLKVISGGNGHGDTKVVNVATDEEIERVKSVSVSATVDGVEATIVVLRPEVDIEAEFVVEYACPSP